MIKDRDILSADEKKKIEPSPGFVISGIHSGCGKTTITLGLISWLRKMGKRVQAFKCGPDFLDTLLHTSVSGYPSHNLDTRMLDNHVVEKIYYDNSSRADISIVEGVMGLFDGADINSDLGSTAHVSKLLGLPVVIVIDVKAMAGTVGALAKGIVDFDPELEIAGFILNGVASDRHYNMLETAISNSTGKLVIARLSRSEDFKMSERHLGLIPSGENKNQLAAVEAISKHFEKTLNLESIMELSQQQSSRTEIEDFPLRNIFLDEKEKKSRPIIAVARDRAFCFYYEENFKVLKEKGAELRFFSPLAGERLPSDCSAVYLGGGYPELYGGVLENNRDLSADLKKAAKEGMPILAECGGYMYLAQSITDTKGNCFKTVGLFPYDITMNSRLQALGYYTIALQSDSILGEKGTKLKGHVFHYASVMDSPKQDNVEDLNPFEVLSGKEERELGYQSGNVLGSWIHFHFLSNEDTAACFVEKAREWDNAKK